MPRPSSKTLNVRGLELGEASTESWLAEKAYEPPSAAPTVPSFSTANSHLAPAYSPPRLTYDAPSAPTTTYASTTTPSSSSPNSAQQPSGTGPGHLNANTSTVTTSTPLPTALKAGIGIAAVLGLIGLITLLTAIQVLRRRRRPKSEKIEAGSTGTLTSSSGDNVMKYELDSAAEKRGDEGVVYELSADERVALPEIVVKPMELEGIGV